MGHDGASTESVRPAGGAIDESAQRAAANADIMVRLREETWGFHQAAEARPVEQALVRGDVTQPCYLAWLAQRAFMHERLEGALCDLATRDPRIAPLIDEPHGLANAARADLEFHAQPAELTPLASATQASAWFAASATTQPLALLGAHYVFEGSKNGARFIARAIRKAHGWGADAVRYLDPHGDEQRPVWEAFKQKMNATRFSPQEQDQIVAGAREAFRLVAALDDELAETWPVAEA